MRTTDGPLGRVPALADRRSKVPGIGEGVVYAAASRERQRFESIEAVRKVFTKGRSTWSLPASSGSSIASQRAISAFKRSRKGSTTWTPTARRRPELTPEE